MEIVKLRSIFNRNGYTFAFFNKILRTFVDKKTKEPTLANTTDDDDNPKYYVLSIPFVGKPSLVFKRKMTSIFNDMLDVYLFQSTKAGSYFSLKSKSPALLLSNVVYKFKCLGDPEQSYIGETTCHIVKRAGEHLDCFSERMPTGIGGHIQKCEPCLQALKAGNLSFKNFEILSRCQSKLEAEVREAFLVTKYKPTMNSQLFMSGASLTLKIFG